MKILASILIGTVLNLDVHLGEWTSLVCRVFQVLSTVSPHFLAWFHQHVVVSTFECNTFFYIYNYMTFSSYKWECSILVFVSVLQEGHGFHMFLLSC